MLGDERPGNPKINADDDAQSPEWAKPRTRPAKLIDPAVGLSMKDVFDLLAKMNEDNQKNFMQFAAEMKKPTAIEQAKLDADAEKIRKQQISRLKLAQAEEQRKENNRLGCPHATVNQATGVSRHAWRAQVHSPAGEKPYFVPTCQICQFQTPKILATADMLTQGVNLDKYSAIDYDVLAKWSQSSQVA